MKKVIYICSILVFISMGCCSQTFKFARSGDKLRKGEYANIDSAIMDSLKVKALNLSWNYQVNGDRKRYSKLPSEIKKLKNLRYLNADGSSLKIFPSGFFELENLQEITIKSVEMQEIPIEITKLKKLKYLNLAHNQISLLPKEIGKLSNLEKLDLSFNKISEFPKEFVGLTSLKELKLSNNGINFNDSAIWLSSYTTQVDWSSFFTLLGSLKQLEILDLYSCNIKELPAEISKLKSLKKLYIGDNLFKQLPDEIQQLSNLEELYFSNWPDDYMSWTEEERQRTEKLLPNCKILLYNYFGRGWSYGKRYKLIIDTRKNAP